MNFFPSPYHDELLYSILGRYAARSGNNSEIHSITDLFGIRTSTAIVELPSRIDLLIDNMPVNSPYTSEYFIMKHTLFPCYAAFTRQERAEEIIDVMKNGNGAVPYIKLGFTTGFLSLNKYLKFCPKCIIEDKQKYGEPYWHRIHQVSGVFFCPIHKTPILDSKILIRGGNRQHIYCVDNENCVTEGKRNFSDKNIKKMIRMAEDVFYLLDKDYKYINYGWLNYQIRSKLIQRGYANMNNYVFQKRLRDDFVDFYGEEYLDLLQSSINNKQHNWLTNIIRNTEYNTFYLRYLLVAHFLDLSLEDLYIENQDMIKEFSNGLDYFQNLWDKRLRELASLKLSIREIASILDSTTKTVRKRIDELEIEPFWINNGGGKYINIKYKDTSEFKEERNERRERWLELLQQNPHLSSNKLREKSQGLHRWLTRYDIDWLRENIRKGKRTNDVIDWNTRDIELLEEVKQVVSNMKCGKPERITWTTIGNKLGIGSWLSKKKDKLPLTKDYIESEIEVLEDFHIRRIKWAIAELEMEEQQITKWKLVKVSGVKRRYWNQGINEVIETKIIM